MRSLIKHLKTKQNSIRTWGTWIWHELMRLVSWLENIPKIMAAEKNPISNPYSFAMFWIPSDLSTSGCIFKSQGCSNSNAPKNVQKKKNEKHQPKQSSDAKLQIFLVILVAIQSSPGFQPMHSWIYWTSWATWPWGWSWWPGRSQAFHQFGWHPSAWRVGAAGFSCWVFWPQNNDKHIEYCRYVCH